MFWVLTQTGGTILGIHSKPKEPDELYELIVVVLLIEQEIFKIFIE